MDSGVYRFQFVAGHLALDFVNTVAYRADAAKKQDRLQRADDVVRWAAQAQLADHAAIEAGPRVGAAALRRIHSVRDQLFAVFHAIAAGDAIPAEALARLGDAFLDCNAKRRLVIERGHVRWTWRASARPAEQLLYPVLEAAIELLTSDARDSVRQCEDAGCGWLFIDRSNARKRRWCSMADCGNRNKARNHYRREAGLA